MKKNKYDVVIVGGGASGLAAAVELGMSSPDLSVLIIEKMKEPGRKIRATGSGRCNITNTNAAGYKRIMEFFTRTGLVTRAYDNGLVYPYSESASDVADLLVERAKRLGVKFHCGEEVLSIKKPGTYADDTTENKTFSKHAGKQKEAFADSGFVVESLYKDEKGEHRLCTAADYVILATGGKAAPTYGTTGDGYRLAREIGHSIVTPVPVLTGIECAEWNESEGVSAINLAGTRTQAVVSLYRNDLSILPEYRGPYFRGEYDNKKPIFRESGEVQFTKYGLSGICIFNMTRCMKYDRAAGESMGDFLIKINLFPDACIADYIEQRQKGDFSEVEIGDLLCTILKKPLADYVMKMFASRACTGVGKHEDVSGGEDVKKRSVSSLDVKDIQCMCEIVHGLEFYPDNLRGWRDAQATSGGVSLDEIDYDTAESKLVSGLYITGELADRDFPCGGYNLSNAWFTGISAADDIALKNEIQAESD